MGMHRIRKVRRPVPASRPACHGNQFACCVFDAHMSPVSAAAAAWDAVLAICRRRGFVYPSAEAHGGLRGVFDYGPFGVELKRNIAAEWCASRTAHRAATHQSIVINSSYTCVHRQSCTAT
jgi:hypothetical protein